MAVPGLTVAEHWPASLAVVILAGQVIVGAVVSFTVMDWWHDAVPELFVAVQVILVVPAGYGSLSGRPSLRELVTVTLSPVVVGVPASTVASQLLLASAVLSGGQVIVGAPPSVTVTVKLH